MITLTLAQLALVVTKAARYQDPAYGSTPEQATEQALYEVFADENGEIRYPDPGAARGDVILITGIGEH